jgi:hypothetical protein
MAQTRRRRRSKHRGTPAGTVETRGRTGRKPTPAERKGSRPARANRFDKPPTWRGAANRGALTAGVLLVALLVLTKKPAAAISLAAFALLFYIPMGYYTDLWLYRRRQRQKAGAGKPRGEKKAE